MPAPIIRRDGKKAKILYVEPDSDTSSKGGKSEKTGHSS